jgi:DNA ligase-1
MAFIDKPMKAEDYEEARLRFPYLASFKLDGYRAFSAEGKIRTSSGTPVLNDFTRNEFDGLDFDCLDGELIVGPWNDRNAFHNTSGPVRKKIGEPDVKWYIFDDRTDPRAPFRERIQRAAERVAAINHPRLVLLTHRPVMNLESMLAFESLAVDQGFEGVMLRDPNGHYKFGRSTLVENLLLKVKRFVSEEATIVALEEQVENLTESEEDLLGRAKKSVSKDAQVGTGMVGAFVVETPTYGKFRISASGLSHKDRKKAWENPNDYIGRLARYKYFPHGVVDVPRHGVFEAIRGSEDL